jgi:hypothetical protein
MDRDLDHKMVDNELAMEVLVHSSSEEASYSPSEEAVYYFPSEVVVYYFPCDAVVRPSSQGADPSVVGVDHNWRMVKILTRVRVEVELHLPTVCRQNSDTQQAQLVDREASLDGNHGKKMVDWEIIKVAQVHHHQPESPVDIQ